MPIRWPSLRERRESSTNQWNILSDQTCNLSAACASSSAVYGSLSAQPLEPDSAIVPRPTTAGGILEGRTRRKLRLDVQVIRPKTSECHNTSAPASSFSSNRNDEGLIGVAFGSPGHPPMAFCTAMNALEAVETDQCSHGLVHPRLDEANWKKFFRGRSTKAQAEITTNGHSAGGAANTQYLLPSRRIPLPRTHRAKARQPENATSGQGYLRAGVRSETSLLDSLLTTNGNNPPKLRKKKSKSLPKLELEIPDGSLGRASTFWKRLPDPASSQPLLARRSKTLENVNVLAGHKPAWSAESIPAVSASLTPLKPPRRIVSPSSMARSPGSYSLFPATSPKYSLFPRSTSHTRLNSQNTFSPSPTKNPLRRTVTSPARLSPIQPHFSVEAEKPIPLQPRRDVTDLTSPEEVTASTEQSAPWSSAASFRSPASSRSSVDEIFFDIRSFRDSKGVDGPQFEMTIPDSAEVQLRRTQSKSTRDVTLLHPSTAAVEPKTRRTPQSIAIDDTIEVVKMLAMSANIDALYEDLASDRPPESNLSSSAEPPVPTQNSSTSSKSKDLTILQPKGIEDNMSTTVFTSAVLSPVTERSERPSPRTSVITKDRSNTNSMLATMSAGLATPLTPARASSEFGGRDSLLGNSPPPMPSLEHMSALISPSLTNALAGREASPALGASNRTPLLQSTAPQASPLPQAISTSPGVSSREEPKCKEPAKLMSQPSMVKVQPHEARPSYADTNVRVDVLGSSSIIVKNEPVQGLPKSATQPLEALPSPGLPPPPVPPKDPKYIPISKFASKSTVATVTQRTGIRPARPTRAMRDLPINPLAANPSISFPKASVAKHTKPKQSLQINSTPRVVHNATPAPPALQAKPSAEVSVARTISLTRRPSARKYVVPASKPVHIPTPTATVATLPRGVVTRSSSGLKGQPIIGPSNPSRRYQVLQARSMSPNQHLRMDENEKIMETPAARMLSPTVVQAERGHKPGVSMNLIVESS